MKIQLRIISISVILILLIWVALLSASNWIYKEFNSYVKSEVLMVAPNIDLTKEQCDNIGEKCMAGYNFLPMDVVYTWVNGSDPLWIESSEFYQNQTPAEDLVPTNIGKHRSADNGELRHSLRSLVRFAPWVRHVYLLTNGQIPNWLNIHHKRITVVSHAEVFKDKTHLPTFNSFAIEANMHRIRGLSEHYIYMNDDDFFGKPIEPEDFVSSKGYKVYWGKTCNDEFKYGGVRVPRRKLMSKNVFYDSLKFTRKNFEKEFGKIKTSLQEPMGLAPHMPFILNKTIIEDLHTRFPYQFDKTSSNRFRSSDDMQTNFAYYLLVMQAMHQPNKNDFLQDIDFNEDGIISEGELELLAARVLRLPIKEKDRTMFHRLVKNCSETNSIDVFTTHNMQDCPSIMRLVEKAIDNVFIYDYEHEIVDRSPDYIFRMLKGDVFNVRRELDYVRNKITKFVCLNDDLNHEDTLKGDIIAEEYDRFHNSLFPDPSPFELPSDSEH